MHPALRHFYYSSSRGGLLPNQVDDLMYWYDMSQETGFVDDGLVATVTDRSGNGRHLTQTSDVRKAVFKTNILNGQPILRFNAVKYYSPAGGKPDVDWMHQGDSTLFWIIKSNVDDAVHYLFDSNSATANNIGRQITFTQIATGNNGSFRDLITAGGGTTVINNLLPTTNATPKDTWLIIVQRFEQAKATEESTIEVNNLLKGTFTQTGAVSASTCSVTPLWFMRSTFATGFDGDVAEWFGYDRALTDDEIRLLVGGNSYAIV